MILKILKIAMLIILAATIVYIGLFLSSIIHDALKKIWQEMEE
jgi:hypothetical protein